MNKIALTYGLISGGVLVILMAITMPLVMNGTIDLQDSQLLGYSSMVLSFIAVFFGIRTYRENVGRGAITFGRAFKVGILITLITSALYVIAWEIAYFNFFPDFADKYAVIAIDEMRAAGASAADIAAKQSEMAKFKEWYKNPLFNVGMTLLEVFPVGLIMTLVSAAILRKRTPDVPAAATAIA